MLHRYFCEDVDSYSFVVKRDEEYTSIAHVFLTRDHGRLGFDDMAFNFTAGRGSWGHDEVKVWVGSKDATELQDRINGVMFAITKHISELNKS